MQKGNIGVTTENIFPVIKKFLYSDHEIFLRELVSNAVDASVGTVEPTGARHTAPVTFGLPEVTFNALFLFSDILISIINQIVH